MICQAAGKEGESVSEFLRAHAVGVADIVVNDPAFTCAPCDVCGHVPGTELPITQGD